jgi:hypothetical protein
MSGRASSQTRRSRTMNDSFTFPVETQRSNFVTVLAWILIVLAGFATFIAVIQNVMLSFMLPMDQMQKAMNDPQTSEQIPAFIRFIFSNVRVFFLVFLGVSSITFISAIGLLKRRNWARIIFICIMALGILWNVFGLLMQHWLFSSMQSEIPPGAAEPQFATMIPVMRIFSFILVIGMCVLFGWIIKKLASRKIKAEFIAVD